jgi:hypothetical protein
LSLRLVSQASVSVGPGIAWSKPFAPTAGEGGALDYDLGCDVALDRIRLDLLEDNTLAPLEVWVKEGEGSSWNRAGGAVVYRLRIDGRASEQREVPLSSPPARRLEIRLGAGGHLGAPAPALEAGVIPRELVLLARGHAPFYLIVGNGNGTGQRGALDMSTLVPGFGTAAEPPISLATVDFSQPIHDSKPAPPSKPPDRRPLVLWGVLIIGVLALALLAWRVLREASIS